MFLLKIKRHIKRVLSAVVFLSPKPVVVSSTGRAGSTMLFDALRLGFIRSRYGVDESSLIGSFLLKLSSVYSDRLSDVAGSPFPVHKTHALYDPKYRDMARYVFIYGDPLESAQSVELMMRKEGMEWFEKHLDHLESSGAFPELYQRDILRFEDQLRSWMGVSRESVFVVSYEDLWDKQAEIARFVGFDFVLPDRRPRTKKEAPENYNTELFDRLRALPAELT